MLKLSFRLFFSVAVFGNARSFLKDGSSFLALLGNYLGNLTLSYDRISLTSDTRIHKQLVYIAKTLGLSVDEIFTFTRAEITAGYGYLVVVRIKSVFRVRIIKGNGNLGTAHLTSVVSTAEDNVFHLRTSEVSA